MIYSATRFQARCQRDNLFGYFRVKSFAGQARYMTANGQCEEFCAILAAQKEKRQRKKNYKVRFMIDYWMCSKGK